MNPLHLFQAYGVELEYMIVDKDTLQVRPIAHLLLQKDGKVTTEIEQGKIAWSNELVQHLIELKTNGPVKMLDGVDNRFQQNIKKINMMLSKENATLMPTAMHPFMDPDKETKIWKHEYTKIYKTYDRIFSCKGHGWSNLQSTHINLPFGNNEEFVKLHDAIRLILPILPAIAASSPIVEGLHTGLHDNRMRYYRDNSKMIPSITGGVIPEQVRSVDEYHKNILQKMYRDIAPHDPKKVLQYEWLNARGAIARFDRGAIEIRVLDVQECPKADLAIVWAVTETLKQIIDSKIDIRTPRLRKVFLDCIRKGETAPVSKEYANALGKKADTAGELWSEIARSLPASKHRDTLRQIIKKGTLSTRIIHSVKKSGIDKTYRRLTGCLAEGNIF
ncbi:MAG: glutamate-cysteine ligase family protein [Candidatus Woesearchaeota archaeon]